MTTPCEQLLEARFGQDVGSDRWWRRVAIEGCPIVQAIGGDRARVLFLWRDPEGDATASKTRCVYIDICSVTDHQSNEPASLERIAGTDVWHWSFEVEAEWRGSYCFIPLDDDHLLGAHGVGRETIPKKWWRSALKFAQTDPLNPNLGHVGLRGQPLSAAHLPQAPFQTAWRDVDRNNRAAADQSRSWFRSCVSLNFLREQTQNMLFSRGFRDAAQQSAISEGSQRARVQQRIW